MSNVQPRKTDPKEKYLSYKSAFDEYENLLESKAYLGAYVLLNSILEDIITSGFCDIRFMLNKATFEEYSSRRCRVESKKKDVNGKTVKMLVPASIANMIDKMRVFDYGSEKFDKTKKDDLTALSEHFKRRNKIIHEAMWNLNVIKKSDCDDLRKLVKTAKRYAAKARRLLKKSEKWQMVSI